MPLRFVIFTLYYGREIGLYVNINALNPENRSMIVYLKEYRSLQIISFKLEGENLEVVPQKVPLWVKEFQPHLVHMIEKEAPVKLELYKFKRLL